MAKRHYHIDSKLLTLAFFVAMPLAAFSAFVVVSMARGALLDSIGQQLELRALQQRLQLERYLGDQVFHVQLVTLFPGVRERIMEARTRRETPGAEAEAPPDILTSPLAILLRETVRAAPSLRLLQVVGSDGQLVASSAPVGRRSLQQAPWFGPMAREETLEPYVSDLHQPPGTTDAYQEIVCPVWHPRTDRWIGAVRALVAASDLGGVLSPLPIHHGERALLIRTDGLILVSDDPRAAFRDTYGGFAAIQAAQSTHRGYWSAPAAPAAEGRPAAVARMVAFSVVEQVPGVSWMVVVERDLSDTVAPVASVTRYLWAHFVGAFATVFLLALYLSLRQETPVIEQALHLHEVHVPPSMSRRASNGSSPAAPPPSDD